MVYYYGLKGSSMEDYNELIQQRFKKLAEISAMGITALRRKV